MPIPKGLGHEHLPGLGQQYEIGLVNVGLTVVETTIGANTAMTDAQVIAAPSNVDGSIAHAAVVHSLGVAPTVVFGVPVLKGGDVTGLVNDVQLQYMTANASASYWRARSFTGAAPAGVGARIVAIR